MSTRGGSIRTTDPGAAWEFSELGCDEAFLDECDPDGDAATLFFAHGPATTACTFTLARARAAASA